MLPVPEGSDRSAERVNTTLNPSMLVAELREIVTGNVALACALDSTLDGAPTLTVAWPQALPAHKRAPATADRQARANNARRTTTIAAMQNPPTMRYRGDTAANFVMCIARSPGGPGKERPRD